MKQPIWAGVSCSVVWVKLIKKTQSVLISTVIHSDLKRPTINTLSAIPILKSLLLSLARSLLFVLVGQFGFSFSYLQRARLFKTSR